MSLVTSPEDSFKGLKFKEKTVKINVVLGSNSKRYVLFVPENLSENELFEILSKVSKENIQGNFSFFEVTSAGLDQMEKLIDIGPNTTIFMYNEDSLDSRFRKLLVDLSCLSLAPYFCFAGISTIEDLKEALTENEKPGFLKNMSWIQKSLWSQMKKKIEQVE